MQEGEPGMDLFTLFGTIAINASGANKTIDETMEKAKGLGDALGGVGTEADKTSDKLKTGSKFSAGCVWLGETLTKLTEKAGELVLKLGKIGFGFNMDMESYQYQFEALIGDADKAKQLIADLQELAKISPLGMEGLANNAVTLLNTGTELTELIPTLEMLGNLSLGDQSKLNGVVRAYTQILNKGQLFSEEINQLADQGVPIIEIMTKFGGEAYEDGGWYQEKLKNPKYHIPAEDMIKAFQAATAEGGKWHDYMLIIMDSFAGQADRLGEEGKETLGAFFQPFFDLAKEEVLPRLIDSLGEFRTWVDENKDSIETFANTVGTVVVGAFDLLLGAVKGVTDAVGWLGDAWETLKEKMTDIKASITVETSGLHTSIDGESHGGGTGKGFANGLYRVPYDGFPAILHKDEAVLNRMDAREWRTANAHSYVTDNATMQEIRSELHNVSALLKGIMTNTGREQSVVLDSGALIGQIAPRMDVALGTIATRRGRG